MSNGFVGGGPLYTGASAVGTQYWYLVTSDGIFVTQSIVPVNASGVFFFAGIGIAGVDSAFTTYAFNALADGGQTSAGCPSGVAHTWENIGLINITVSSTLNRLIGVYLCANSLQGPQDSQFNPPFVLGNVSLIPGADTSSWIIGTGTYGPVGKSNACLCFHQAGQYGAIGDWFGTSGAPNAPASTLQTLWKNGYTIMGVSGCKTDNGAATEPTTAHFGMPAGLVYRKAQVDWLQKYMPWTQKIVALGVSMGGITALEFEMQYGGILAAIQNVSGVADLSDTYTNRGFAGTIQLAAGTWYICITANADVAFTAAKWLQANFSYEAPAEAYFNGITTTLTGALTNASATVTNVGSTAGLVRGQPITGASGFIAAGTTIKDFTNLPSGNTITLSAVATGTDSADSLTITAANNRNTWVSGTAYAVGDMVCISNAIAEIAIQSLDPNTHYEDLIRIPMRFNHSPTDATIPFFQSQNIVNGINAAGGQATLNSIGTGHATANVFDPAQILSFFG
jgi:hypothetical protein